MTAGQRGGHDSDLRVHDISHDVHMKACVCPMTMGRDQPKDNSFISDSRTSSACLYAKTTICQRRLNPIWPQIPPATLYSTAGSTGSIKETCSVSPPQRTAASFSSFCFIPTILFQTTSVGHLQTRLTFIDQDVLFKNTSMFR